MPSTRQAAFATIGALVVGLLLGFELAGWSNGVTTYMQQSVFRKTASTVTPATTLSSWQPKTSAVPCPGQSKLLTPDMYKAQFEEDKELMEWFGTLCNGTYIEMGALDGLLFSNSYAFHKGLGWKGMLLEASPKWYKGLVSYRPDELALVHAGVCAQEGELHWVEGRLASTGGFLEFATEEHKGLYFPPKEQWNPQPVTCQPLKKILKEKLGDNLYFDFFSLDVEGAELQVLQTIDFSKVSFGIILVEIGNNKIKDHSVRTLLEENGYSYFPRGPAKFEIENNWFINKRWHSIYADVAYT